MPTLESVLHDLETQGYIFIHTDTPNHTLAEYRASRTLDQLLAEINPVANNGGAVVLFEKKGNIAQCTVTMDRVVVDEHGCWIPENPVRPKWVEELLETWSDDVDALQRYGANVHAEVLAAAIKDLYEAAASSGCCDCDDCTCD